MDLFTAGLGESPLSGGVVGQTFACVIAHQFEMLQKGDRFFFTHPPAGHPSGSSGLTDDQLVRLFFFTCGKSRQVLELRELLLFVVS